MGKELTFAVLDDLLTKNVDERGSVITKNKFSEVDEWIHSGNYLFNAQLSGSLFGGYPNSRSVALAGETGCLQGDETIKVYIFQHENVYGRHIIKNGLCNMNTFINKPLEKLIKDECSFLNLKENQWNQYIEEYSKIINAKNLVKNHKNDTVLIDGPDGFQLLGDFYIKENKQIIETITKGNFKAQTSNDHLYETPDGWKKIKDLNKNDLIKTKNGFEEVKSLEEKGIETTYDWEVLHENHRYWAGNGLSSHNTGKTFLALNACREAQKVGYNIIFCDSEAAISKKEVEKFGIDPDKFRYQPINTPKQFSHFVANLVDTVKLAKKEKREVPKIMLVLDSLGNLSTDKARADAMSGSLKKDMTKAQEIKSLFSLVTMDLAEAKIPFILTAHTYASISSFYPMSVMGGGCFVAGTKIQTPHGLKNIEDFKPGDEVTTFHGTEIVGAVHEFTKELFEIRFDDGSSYLCSYDHRFLTGTKLNDDEHYTAAKRLQLGDHVKRKIPGQLRFERLKVTKSKPYTEKKQGIHATVFDLTVPSNNYLLDNNVISHNSGALYNTSIINFLYKAKLAADVDKKTNVKKENSDVKSLDMKSTGIVVRSTPHKNRFARPIQIRFHISFYHGMNPFVGLEQFISFKNCGIEKGNIIHVNEYKKLKTEEKQEIHDNSWDWKDENDKQFYFQPRSTARNYVVRHLNGTVPAAQLFTSNVFTREVLEVLDETIIKPTFTLPDVGEMNDNFENLLDEGNMNDVETEDMESPLDVKVEDFTTE